MDLSGAAFIAVASRRRRLYAAGFSVTNRDLPGPIRAKINADLNRLLRGADLQRKLADQGIDVAPSTQEEFRAYVERGFFYNATARTVSGYIGMIFRRDPVLQLPDKSVALHLALRTLANDVDLLGTTLGQARNACRRVRKPSPSGRLARAASSRASRPR